MNSKVLTSVIIIIAIFIIFSTFLCFPEDLKELPTAVIFRHYKHILPMFHPFIFFYDAL